MSMDQRPRMRVVATVLGAPDTQVLADFYQRLLAWDRTQDVPGWVKLRPPSGGTGLSFQHEPEFVPPVWPAAPREQQMTSHLDIAVEDLDAGVAWAQEAGAVLAEHQPQAEVRVMLDPAGHPFCLFARSFRGGETSGAARQIIDTNLYMTLGTADEAGRPWATPVYFAPVDYREFLWVSKPGARHSRNIAVRPEVGIVVFDSTVPISTGQGVYVDAVVDELTDSADLGHYLELFSDSAVARGGRRFAPEDVAPGARLRFYRATATDHWLLDEHDERIPVDL
jgi:hypothetical protein